MSGVSEFTYEEVRGALRRTCPNNTCIQHSGMTNSAIVSEIRVRGYWHTSEDFFGLCDYYGLEPWQVWYYTPLKMLDFAFEFYLSVRESW